MKKAKVLKTKKRKIRLTTIILIAILIFLFWVERNYSDEIQESIFKYYLTRYGGDINIGTLELPKIQDTDASRKVDETLKHRLISQQVIPDPNRLGKGNLFAP